MEKNCKNKSQYFSKFECYKYFSIKSSFERSTLENNIYMEELMACKIVVEINLSFPEHKVLKGLK